MSTNKGATGLLSSYEQDVIRRTAKKGHRNKGGHFGPSGFYDGLQADKRQSELELVNRQRAAYAARQGFNNRARNTDWDEDVLTVVTEYINVSIGELGLYDHEESIEDIVAGLPEDAVQAARFHIAFAIAKATYKPTDTLGQQADWYPEMERQAQATLVRRATSHAPKQRIDDATSGRQFVVRVAVDYFKKRATDNRWSDSVVTAAQVVAEAEMGLRPMEEADQLIESGALSAEQLYAIRYNLTYNLLYVATRNTPVDTPAQNAGWFPDMCDQVAAHRQKLLVKRMQGENSVPSADSSTTVDAEATPELVDA